MRAGALALLLVACVFSPTGARAQATMALGPGGLPAWVKDAGARREPTATRVFSANDYGARPDTLLSSTAGIQQAIDAAFRAGGGTLGDPEIAAVSTYIRSSWGNQGDAVTVAEVAAIRAASANRTTPWTVVDLMAASAAPEK